MDDVPVRVSVLCRCLADDHCRSRTRLDEWEKEMEMEGFAPADRARVLAGAVVLVPSVLAQLYGGHG